MPRVVDLIARVERQIVQVCAGAQADFVFVEDAVNVAQILFVLVDLL
jgi:hypothetical protein